MAVPEREAGSADEHNGIKGANKGKRAGRPRAERLQCVRKAHRLPACLPACARPRAISPALINTQRLASDSHAPRRWSSQDELDPF